LLCGRDWSPLCRGQAFPGSFERSCHEPVFGLHSVMLTHLAYLPSYSAAKHALFWHLLNAHIGDSMSASGTLLDGRCIFMSAAAKPDVA
jgi:hypothetical protein